MGSKDIESLKGWIAERRADIEAIKGSSDAQIVEWAKGTSGLQQWLPGLNMLEKGLDFLETARARLRALPPGLGADANGNPTPGGQVYVSAPAAVSLAVVAGIAGAAGGWFGKGALDKRKHARELPAAGEEEEEEEEKKPAK